MNKQRTEKIRACRGCHYEVGESGGCATWGCDGVAQYGTEEIDRLTYQLFVSRRPRPEAPKCVLGVF